MNNSYNTSADAELQLIIQDVYQSYIQDLTSISVIALLLYTTILSIGQEKEHVWSKKFTLPNLLYLLTRYGSLATQVLEFALFFLQPGSLCNHIANAGNAAFTLTYIGIQGLLVARAYSLCYEHKIVVCALGFSFLGGFTLGLYTTIRFPGCIALTIGEADLLNILANISTVSIDLLVFGICLWKVWDTWKLKRETGIRSSNDLVYILIKQLISRFCFVVLISATSTILEFISSNAILKSDVPIFQQALSTILIAEFTLDLRQRNSAAVQASSVALPTLQIQSMLQYVHESIVVGMGDHDQENIGALAGGEGIARNGADHDNESVHDATFFA